MIISCKYCGCNVKVRKFIPNLDYFCPRCDGLIYRTSESSLLIFIMSISSLSLLFWAMMTPILNVTVIDTKTSSIYDSLIFLFNSGFFFSFIIIFCTIIIAPAIMLILINIIIILKFLNIKNSISNFFIDFYYFLKDWNMAEVYLFSIIISMIKLEELTILHIDYGFWFHVIYTIMFFLTTSWFNPKEVINDYKHKKIDENSILKSIIFLSIAFIFLLPSNLIPIMPTFKFSVTYDNTIYDGIHAFYEEGDYFISFIIFFTSICIPVLKILGITVMIFMAKYNLFSSYKREAIKYYRFTDTIGKYSMVDVYVVILSATFVQYDHLIRIEIGDGIIPFMLVVFFTMLGSKSFDIRLLYQNKTTL
jgi:paraquat-inducible protein A